MRQFLTRLWQFLLNNSTLILFVAVFVIFGLSSPRTVIGDTGLEFPRFWLPENILNIIKQAAVFAGIIGVGMTFVLLTAGIDLSVGSNMYLSVVCAGLLMRSSGLDIVPAMIVSLLVGMLFGAFNAFCIVRLKIIPFMTTLATLVIGRGLGTALTESQQIDFPERMNAFGQTQVLGFIPMPIVFFAAVVIAAWFVLTRTQFGRQVYAVGNDIEAAKKAGINTDRTLAMVYIISGLCAGLAGFILASQLGGRVDRSFGETREFDAIAAAVLGGTSLFGGVGNVFGTVVGALLIQMVGTGLQFNLVNLYLQPMARAFVIFLAIFFDSLREANIKKLKRRFIRPLHSPVAGSSHAEAGD
ncbi:MAG: ABC transporter permease [Chloroflexi bacterium]|nr:ABC transporter permease [Chloroflexota bacterium]